MALARKTAAPLVAYVLHQWDWSESSLIVDIFTRARGRIVVVAKGAKRPTSNLRAVLMPFARLLVTTGRPAKSTSEQGEQDEVQPLRHVEWAGGAPMLPAPTLMAGFYCNELLMKLLARHDAHPLLFDAYAATLDSLARGDDSVVQAALRAFELLLLRETGVLPELDRTTLTQVPVQADRPYSLRADAGVAAGAAEPDNALDGATLLALQAALDRGDLGALQAAALAQLPALRVQLRALLQYHLGHVPLRTRQVMQGVQRLLDTSSPAR